MLSEIGEGKPGVDGLEPIGWVDIDAWSRLTGAEVTPGEAAAIKYLSICYVAQYNASRDPGCPAPHIRKETNSEQVESRLKTLFSMLRT